MDLLNAIIDAKDKKMRVKFRAKPIYCSVGDFFRFRVQYGAYCAE
jgi:hypothetical protein